MSTERFPVWFEFGKHSDGTVDIADVEGDVFIRVPAQLATQLIEARNYFCSLAETFLRDNPQCLPEANKWNHKYKI